MWSLTSASPGNVLEMHILQPRRRPAESETLGVRPPGCVCVIRLLVNLVQAEVWEPLS